MHYRIETIVNKKLSPTYTKTLQTIRKVSILYDKKQDGLSRYLVLTTQYKFSNQENSTQAILKKIAYLFDRLELGADENRRICRVFNRSELKMRWQRLELEILKNNEGYALKSYCAKITELLSKEDQLIEFLHQNDMLGMFFNGNHTETMGGQFYYNEKQILEEGYLEIKAEHHHTKYSILWLGF
ncbi:hypothetical protein EQP59_02085 [Ornithobacterium rhinotracheale]|uniref:Uncharacterized protein n=1 Tax=Ornithobacterium rhinotracheale TaxID=28251 RepID=A0A3R5WYT3_ORNRH|nr:hypothetical protein [Ornithobacterium rhinotracheale]QAR30229.1 hypothetical protein EQP59_02085 [Ornithobacterium rhinotracheale]